MPNEPEEIFVFVASPSDVPEERDAIRRAADEVIAAIRLAMPIRVTVTGWEEVPPAFGRPQATINPLVAQCHLFVGLLNRRWGTHTGVFSSGFEEEFELALSRRRTGSVPEIFMYFREVPEDALSDPGTELTKVLAFKEKVHKERILLYKTYKNTDSLQRQFSIYLLAYLMARINYNQESRPALSGTVPEKVVAIKTNSDSDLSDPARVQLAQMLEQYLGVIRGVPGSSPLNPSRLLLFAETVARNGPAVDAHLANSLYRPVRSQSIGRGTRTLAEVPCTRHWVHGKYRLAAVCSGMEDPYSGPAGGLY